MVNQEPCQPAPDEREDILDLLIHDIRSPLGVAEGYLLLLTENRLPTDQARTLALQATAKSLARISALCRLAAQCAPVADTEPGVAVRCDILSDRVAQLAGARVHVEARSASTGGFVAVGTSLDRVAEAVVELLKVGAITIASEAGRLHCSTQGETGQELSPAARSLETLAARRVIERVGGRVTWVREGPGKIDVSFPLQGEQA